jgi:hypothetical protein
MIAPVLTTFGVGGFRQDDGTWAGTPRGILRCSRTQGASWGFRELLAAAALIISI